MRELAELLRPMLTWVYRRPQYFPQLVDILIWPLALTIGAILKLVFSASAVGGELVLACVAAMVLQGVLGWASGLYRNRWRVASFEEVMALSSVWAAVTAVLVLANYIGRVSQRTGLPTTGVITGALTALVMMSAVRALWRRHWESSRRPEVEGCTRTIVFGAGEGGAQIIRAMMNDKDSQYYPVALLDDNEIKQNRELSGVKVRGTRKELAEVAQATRAETLLVAIPSANASLIKDLATRAREIGLEVRVLPTAADLVGRMSLADVRPPTVDDLLGRDPVHIDLESVVDYIQGKRVLVTGAGGSIGSELSRQIRGFGPFKLVLLDRDETALHSLQLSMEGRALLDTDQLVVADIRDRERMFEVFSHHRPEVVFHAAALKHLTLLETHPEEGIKTNALGTKNVLDAARARGVERFVNISTDKAADPSSVLGATKLAAERLTAMAARETGLPYVSVRFGNVLGSRGSVLPTFLGQIEQGKPITVTHPDVTRYFMTIPEAVRLVVQAAAIGEPGEVLILDMGEPVKIVDLAQQLIDMLSPNTTIEFTGLRRGEKLHEVLTSRAEHGEARIHPRINHTLSEYLSPFSALELVPGLASMQAAKILNDLRHVA